MCAHLLETQRDDHCCYYNAYRKRILQTSFVSNPAFQALVGFKLDDSLDVHIDVWQCKTNQYFILQIKDSIQTFM